MPAKHPEAMKRTVVVLAHLDGELEAAKAAKVDPSTVREWVKAAGDPASWSLEMWTASRDYAKSQELRAMLDGNPSRAFAWSKPAGVGDRNVYVRERGTAVAAPEAEAEGVGRSSANVVVDAMPEDRQRAVRDYILLRLDLARIYEVNGEAEPTRGGEGESDGVSWLEQWRDAPDAEVVAAFEQVKAEAAEHLHGWHAYVDGRGKVLVDRNGTEHPYAWSELYESVPVVTDHGDGRDVTPTTPESPAAPAEPLPLPVAAVSAPREHATVIDTGPDTWRPS